jgi:two-component system NarL family response regulator
MKPLRILLVDDHAEFLNAATTFLAERPGIEIVGKARSGREAVNQTPILMPDLVLIDLMMTEMGGLEATRLLKRLPDPPTVIIVSLHDDQSFRAAAREAGADGFVAKREFSKQLMPLLEKLIRGAPDAADDGVRPSCSL